MVEDLWFSSALLVDEVTGVSGKARDTVLVLCILYAKLAFVSMEASFVCIGLAT